MLHNFVVVRFVADFANGKSSAKAPRRAYWESLPVSACNWESLPLSESSSRYKQFITGYTVHSCTSRLSLGILYVFCSTVNTIDKQFC